MATEKIDGNLNGGNRLKIRDDPTRSPLLYPTEAIYMKVTVTPFGELTFGRYFPSAGDIFKVPHSRPFTARGSFGSFFCQFVQAKEYYYCYSVLRPAEDITIQY